MKFSRPEYWSGLPFLTPGDLPDPGIEPASRVSPALVGRLFPLCHLGSTSYNTCFLQGHNHGLEKSSWSLEAEMPGLDYVACQFLVLHCWAGPFILHFSFSICRMRQTLNSQTILVKWKRVVQEVPGLCGLSGRAFPCLMSSLCMCVLLPGLKGNDHLLYKMSPYFLWLAIENVHTGS